MFELHFHLSLVPLGSNLKIILIIIKPPAESTSLCIINRDVTIFAKLWWQKCLHGQKTVSNDNCMIVVILFLFFLYINITTRLVRLACYQGGGVLIVTSRTIRCSCKTATSSGLKRKGELIPLCVTATLHTVTNPFLPRRHPFLPLHLWWASPLYSFFPELSRETFFFFIPCSIPHASEPWSYNLPSNEQIRAGTYVLRALIRTRGDRWECGHIKVTWSLGGNCSGWEVELDPQPRGGNNYSLFNYRFPTPDSPSNTLPDHNMSGVIAMETVTLAGA